ncbi:YpmS family protein [Ornithinibacillus sp. BX22]|uniref:YpmS family protein n=2 Tax=Ornithinibacillus TaxID=484508 RepID=A0A923L304_9BACI|nr:MULTISPECIES: YpmS family protein [Ornithinibacillus]MBC5635552.1 YpmS family protein [Ornithinibacillus hominis]MBS3679162.1 YpmS family protein [Ornithinibacillus massiliensis]
MEQEKPNKNLWKSSFIALLLLNFSVLVIIALLIFWPVERSKVPAGEHQTTQNSSEFIIRTTKKNLNELINAYMYEYMKDSKHKYSVSLEEDVQLVGELPVFSTTVPLSIRLEPFVQDNGDVVLKQKSISLGLLELPNKKVMEYMSKYLPMPNWVTINPDDEEIYVAVTQMDIKSNFHVSVEQMDLEANNLSFKLKVPYETLGIETFLSK